MNKPDWETNRDDRLLRGVDDEVTLIVRADGAAKCTGRDKYARPTKETAREMKQKARQRGKLAGCRGDDCQPYRNTIPR